MCLAELHTKFSYTHLQSEQEYDIYALEISQEDLQLDHADIEDIPNVPVKALPENWESLQNVPIEIIPMLISSIL